MQHFIRWPVLQMSLNLQENYNIHSFFLNVLIIAESLFYMRVGGATSQL